jgi:hypothetical protein
MYSSVKHLFILLSLCMACVLHGMQQNIQPSNFRAKVKAFFSKKEATTHRSHQKSASLSMDVRRNSALDTRGSQVLLDPNFPLKKEAEHKDSMDGYKPSARLEEEQRKKLTEEVDRLTQKLDKHGLTVEQAVAVDAFTRKKSFNCFCCCVKD